MLYFSIPIEDIIRHRDGLRVEFCVSVGVSDDVGDGVFEGVGVLVNF